MTLIVPWAEAPTLEGREFVGDWFTIDREKLPLFDEATYTTENPNELDESGYPEDLVEGFHLLALLDHLLNRAVHLSGEKLFAWNYGLDRVRFVSPVRAGEPVRLTGTVASVEPRGEGYLILFDCTLEVHGRDKPGFVAAFRALWQEA